MRICTGIALFLWTSLQPSPAFAAQDRPSVAELEAGIAAQEARISELRRHMEDQDKLIRQMLGKAEPTSDPASEIARAVTFPPPPVRAATRRSQRTTGGIAFGSATCTASSRGGFLGPPDTGKLDVLSARGLIDDRRVQGRGIMTSWTLRLGFSALAAMAAMGSPAIAQQSVAPAEAAADAPWPEAWFEVFKLAPGKQEEFVRRVARADEVARAGGQPPIQLYFHENGAEWDVIVYKPVTGAKPTPAQQAAMDAKARELRIESGPAYFVAIRELVASHEDSKAYGPISAAQWLGRLDKWRRENPPRK